MREIKFRAWTGEHMVYFSLFDPDLDGAYHIIYQEYLEGKSVMQFTGLKDKNGKEIYEGDICRYRWYINDNDIAEEIIDKVEFTDGSFMFHVSPLWEWRKTQKPWDILLEIIGNIYENPELLEDK